MLFTLQTTVVIIMFKLTLYYYCIHFGDDSVKLEQQLKGLLDRYIDSSELYRGS